MSEIKYHINCKKISQIHTTLMRSLARGSALWKEDVCSYQRMEACRFDQAVGTVVRVQEKRLNDHFVSSFQPRADIYIYIV